MRPLWYKSFMTDSIPKKQVKCPNCRNLSVYDTKNSFRPFCSEKCKMIDLGDWAEERFSLKAEEEPSPEEMEQAFLEKIRQSKH